MPEKAAGQEIARDYLTRGGNDLESGSRAFLSIDLVHGRMRAYSGDEYAETAPALVGSGWHMRWSIPPVDNDRANQLLNDVADSAANLFGKSAIREEPLGVILYGGAGTSVDLINRRCADLWKEHYEGLK
ncbi:hypothetical protein [Streptomyces sp. MBT53]|uniref:hypothetical protein n=1 Tax=Streptomyces sp. MBT53 TaxID=1488384 RepID=UPI001912A5D3|nr:hypothetical protein [Streptomyces sp. MBT53]MBK6015801.1 hypothetical protein [Streptomyces sp. MBT53]